VKFNFMPRAKKPLAASKVSPGVERNERLNTSPTGLPDLPEEVLKARNKHLDLARRASSQRERRSEFFDMMTYTRDYERNRQYANTLLRLKKNDSEVRVNAGTLEKKSTCSLTRSFPSTWRLKSALSIKITAGMWSSATI
jgi:hypothetical protein